MRKPHVISILLGDIHISHKVPPCHVESKWYDVMRSNIEQVCELQRSYECPVVCSGDVFDFWNCPVEAVNFATERLPHMYAIPGQHDLPYHNLKLWKRSAYGNLVLSGKITPLQPGKRTVISEELVCYGFPWGYAPKPVQPKDKRIHLAVCHRFIWIKGKAYPGAPKEERLGAYREALEGYHAAVFGDNHKGFLAKSGECHVLNNGSLMRRKSDQVDYKPRVGLLLSDGSIRLHYLDTSSEDFGESSKTMKKGNFDNFVKQLQETDSNEMDYCEMIHKKAECTKVTPGAAKLLLDSIS